MRYIKSGLVGLGFAIVPLLLLAVWVILAGLRGEPPALSASEDVYSAAEVSVNLHLGIILSLSAILFVLSFIWMYRRSSRR